MLEMSNLGISTVTLITSHVSAQLLYADLDLWSVLRWPLTLQYESWCTLCFLIDGVVKDNPQVTEMFCLSV